MRGGEKVLEALLKIFPEADIFTHVVDKSNLKGLLKEKKIHTTFISKLPYAKKFYKNYLPLMPMALESLDLSGYDLVISSESGPSKGIITDPDAVHICYCHSPMRYLWDLHSSYSSEVGRLKRILMAPLLHYMRIWDVTSSSRVDYFIANSSFISKRVEKFYRRQAEIIHPPVSISDFTVSRNQRNFYLVVGQLVGYKKVDLAIKAFNKLGKKLIVIGEGEDYERLCKLAGPNVSMLGKQPFHVLKEHYSACKALIFPGIEDFGIVPIEAMASGRPVIAYKKGGAIDYVIHKKTGYFFNEQTVTSLANAVKEFELIDNDFDSSFIVEHARKFSDKNFSERIKKFVNERVNIGDFRG